MIARQLVITSKFFTQSEIIKLGHEKTQLATEDRNEPVPQQPLGWSHRCFRSIGSGA